MWCVLRVLNKYKSVKLDLHDSSMNVVDYGTSTTNTFNTTQFDQPSVIAKIELLYSNKDKTNYSCNTGMRALPEMYARQPEGCRPEG